MRCIIADDFCQLPCFDAGEEDFAVVYDRIDAVIDIEPVQGMEPWICRLYVHMDGNPWPVCYLLDGVPLEALFPDE